MSLFASRRNTRTEERVMVMELQEFLDAREVPRDPIRRAKFWADYNRSGRESTRAERLPGGIVEGDESNAQRPGGVSTEKQIELLQLFDEEAA